MDEMATKTADEKIELKQCPFCGAHAHVEQNGNPDSYAPAGYFTVCCVTCDATIDYRCYSPGEAAEKWNTRVDTRSTRQRAEQAAAKIFELFSGMHPSILWNSDKRVLTDIIAAEFDNHQ